MNKKEYAALLNRPEWKRKREEILIRDNYTCSSCGDDKDSGVKLHVHHLYYVGNATPWDYPDKALTTLCAGCHKDAHNGFKRDNEPYFMVFLSALAPSLNLTMGELRLMAVLNTFANYNTGAFALTTKDRDNICEMLSIKRQSLSNALNGLKRKLLLSYDRGEWQINPEYFWKGEMKVREQMLQDKEMSLTFSICDSHE